MYLRSTVVKKKKDGCTPPDGCNSRAAGNFL